MFLVCTVNIILNVIRTANDCHNTQNLLHIILHFQGKWSAMPAEKKERPDYHIADSKLLPTLSIRWLLYFILFSERRILNYFLAKNLFIPQSTEKAGRALGKVLIREKSLRGNFLKTKSKYHIFQQRNTHFIWNSSILELQSVSSHFISLYFFLSPKFAMPIFHSIKTFRITF